MKHLPNYDHTNDVLEDVFSYEPPIPPIVIVDWKVYCHDVHKEIPQLEAASRGSHAKLVDLIQATWAYKLHRGPEMMSLEEFCIIVVDDCKHQLPAESKGASGNGAGYWRHIEAHKLGLGEYKGGRETKPATFTLVEEVGYAYLKKLGITPLSKPLFEADDFAGEIVRIKRNADPSSDLYNRLLVLSTVDNDWSGLVSDEHFVIWANTGPWLPRLRAEAEVCDYFFRKEGLKLEKANECYTFKAEFGDASDNLPAGSPVRLFDLYNADSHWTFAQEESEFLTEILHQVQVNNRKDHLEASRKFIVGSGLIPIGHPPATRADFRAFIERAKETRRSKALSVLKGLRAKKVCEQLFDGPKHLLDKCIKLALEVKLIKKKTKTLVQKLEEMRESATKAELKEVRAEKKKLKEREDECKKQVDALVPQ